MGILCFILIVLLQWVFSGIYYRQGWRHAMRKAKEDGYIPMFEEKD